MTKTNEDLASTLALARTKFTSSPWTGVSDLMSMGALREDFLTDIDLAVGRLRSMAALDQIDVAPARTTDPSTSKAAARTITADNNRGKIALAFYRDRVTYDGPGLTASQAVKMAGLAHLASPWKRVSELKEAGIIVPTGVKIKSTVTGQMQEQLILTDHGRSEVERLMPDAPPVAARRVS